MTANVIRNLIQRISNDFGGKLKDENQNGNYILRANESFYEKDNPYWGIINPEENLSGQYHDFSIVIFPAVNNGNLDINKPWLICLGVGSYGFKNDYELAKTPGLRRLFSKIIDVENAYIKSDFSDIETGIPNTFAEKVKHFKNNVLANPISKGYGKLLPVIQIVEPPKIFYNHKNKLKKYPIYPINPINHNKIFINLITEGLEIYLKKFIAAYAKIRNWPTNNNQRININKILSSTSSQNSQKDKVKEISALLKERKYIVLQGPPGTGKTHTASKVCEKFNNPIIFFTQFHAETSFSDFVYGIRPHVSNNTLSYEIQEGILVQAIRHAMVNQNKDVILIIDEINRSNLSNVLGPVFYLFEYQSNINNFKIEISPGFKIEKLPENFYVIATMNTADRSLAVVDFALRRRFAWYTLKPEKINLDNGNTFFEKDFNTFSEIFEWYATSEELNLQPGQGYFIAKDENKMKDRIRYELYPLIKEYLQEGYLLKAKEEFNNYFLKRINLSLFD